MATGTNSSSKPPSNQGRAGMKQTTLVAVFLVVQLFIVLSENKMSNFSFMARMIMSANSIASNQTALQYFDIGNETLIETVKSSNQTAVNDGSKRNATSNGSTYPVSSTNSNNSIMAAATKKKEQLIPGIRSDPNDVGSWLADQWVPPLGWKLYTANEMRAYFRKHSILFVGDSMSRRVMATLYGILNATDPDDIMKGEVDNPDLLDVNKQGSTTGKIEKCSRELLKGPPETKNGTYILSVCRNIPGTQPEDKRFYHSLSTVCHHQIDEMIKYGKANIQSNYSIVFFLLGAWEVGPRTNRHFCDAGGGPNFPEGTYMRMNRTLRVLPQLASPNTHVLWRTSGFHKYLLNKEVTVRLNTQVRAFFDKFQKDDAKAGGTPRNLTLINWDQGIWPRSERKKRIVGDKDFHYGLEARLMLVQMFMNTLIETELKEKQRQQAQASVL